MWKLLFGLGQSASRCGLPLRPDAAPAAQQRALSHASLPLRVAPVPPSLSALGPWGSRRRACVCVAFAGLCSCRPCAGAPGSRGRAWHAVCLATSFERHTVCRASKETGWLGWLADVARLRKGKCTLRTKARAAGMPSGQAASHTQPRLCRACALFSIRTANRRYSIHTKL